MGTLPVTAVIEQAEMALAEGRYREAMRLCQGLLRAFPRYLTAQRLLGRAALRAGETGLAEEAFQTVRQLDPEDREAALGLSQIAEQRGELETALAFRQAAWECSPWDRELREGVARLAQACYGEGHLFLTGAALASQHSRGGCWTRAATECRAVLEQGLVRPDVQQRLAVALWRRGDLEGAARVCESLTGVLPDAVVPLVILASIAQVHGEPGEAAALLHRAHVVDVDGSRVAALLLEAEEGLRSSLLPVAIPEIEETVLLAEAAAPEAVAMVAAPDEVGLAAPEEAREVLLELPSEEELEAARPREVATAGYTSLLRSLEGEGLEPFSPLEGGGEVAAEPTEEAILELPTDEEIEAARPREVLEPGWTGLLKAYEIEGIEPFVPEGLEVPGEPAAGGEAGRVPRGKPRQVEGVPREVTAEAAGEGPPESAPVEETISWLEHAVIGRSEVPEPTEPTVLGEAAEEEVVAALAPEEAEGAVATGAGRWEVEGRRAVQGDEREGQEALAAAAEQLGVGPELFARSRAAKEELVATGQLSGEATRVRDAAAERAAGGVADPLAVVRDLLVAGEVEAALARCRALYRARRDLDRGLIELLTPLADGGGPGAAEADRILGAVYRRQGALALAARHYERSLRRGHA